jgi:hypothetical protein
MEEPALLEALGSVAGRRVVDLGCGDAALGRVLLRGGCARYLGLDGSERMVAAAEATLRGTPGEVVHGDIDDFAPASTPKSPSGDGHAPTRRPSAIRSRRAVPPNVNGGWVGGGSSPSGLRMVRLAGQTSVATAAGTQM